MRRKNRGIKRGKLAEHCRYTIYYISVFFRKKYVFAAFCKVHTINIIYFYCKNNIIFFAKYLQNQKSRRIFVSTKQENN